MQKSEIIGALKGRHRGRASIPEHEAKAMLRHMGFPVPRGTFLAKGETIPERLELTFPLVAKVSSPAVVSKTNVGGVKVGIKDKEELMRACRELSEIRSAEGVLVEEMAPQGLEVIIGGVIDGQFGPVVMFGLGGIFVELFRDVAFGLAPLTTEEAFWLITQVKGHALLKGYRGSPAVDGEALAGMIVAVSEVMATGVVSEIDLNPVALYPHGSMVLDAKIQLLP